MTAILRRVLAVVLGLVLVAVAATETRAGHSAAATAVPSAAATPSVVDTTGTATGGPSATPSAETSPSPTAGVSSAQVSAASLQAPVRASVVCPDLRLLPGTLVSTIAVGNATPASGTVTLAPAAGTRAGQSTELINAATAAGDRVSSYKGPLTGPLVLSAQGALTGSLVADQVARGNKTSDRGWSEVRCQQPTAVQWFVGAATEPGDTPVLELSNPDATAAVTTVTVLTPSGVVATSAAENIELAPHSVQYVPLSSLAPAQPYTAVEVSTETGEVAASIRDVRTHGETLLGTDWVPAGVAADTVVVSGLPGLVTGAAPARTLYIGDPGDVDITATVTVTTQEGTFVPTGMASIALTAGEVTAVNVGTRLGSNAATVTVTSSDPGTPIVAGVLVDAASTTGYDIHEITYLGSAQPLLGPALVPYIAAGTDQDSVLVLSAPQGATAVAIRARSAKYGAFEVRVAVGAGTTRVFDLAPYDLVDQSAITVRSLLGQPLYVTRLIEEAGLKGPLLSSFQLVGAPAQVPVPSVTPLPLGSLS